MDSVIPRLDLEGATAEETVPKAESSSTKRDADRLPTIDPLQRRNLFIITEFRAICNRPPEGIYVRPSEQDLLEWYGVIVVKAGVFAGGIFRFTLTLPNAFPDTDEVPTVEFEQNLFHPMIYSKTNRVDFKRFFPSGWAPERNHVYHVLQALQAVFFRCDCTLEHAANPEAALLWTNDRKQFKKFANNVVRESRTQIYDHPKSDDPQALRFKPWDASIMEPVLKMILNAEPVPKEHPLAEIISKEHNPYASFFNAEKATYLCDVIPDLPPVVDKHDGDETDLHMDVQSDEEGEIHGSYTHGIEEDDV